MRILLTTEGDSDEVVAQGLLKSRFGEVSIHPKSLPGRGVEIVLRVASDCVRAAYFGHFDMLVVHFDMDDTLPDGFVLAQQSDRWIEINSRINTTLESLPEIHRSSELKIVLMTPRESTDAWLIWGLKDESGPKWELKDRHQLKRDLYGDPPRGMKVKAAILAARLIVRCKRTRIGQ